MSRASHTVSLSRCLLVWLAVSLVAGGALHLLLPELIGARALADPTSLDALPYDRALALIAAVLLAACVVWGWTVASLVVCEAATSVRIAACPGPVRRVVLLACGISLATGLSPAGAEQTVGQPPRPSDPGPAILTGLQLPDRSPTLTTTGAGGSNGRDPHSSTPRPAAGAGVVVLAGDTLWAIASETLPPRASDAEIDARWREIWRANRAAVGAEPDLILPGTALRLPPNLTDRSPFRTEEK